MPFDVVKREFEKFSDPVPLKQHGPAKIISLCNQKGGVGKTTTTINLAAAFAELERKVLIVDFDPQGAASVGLGINAYNLDKTVYDLLIDRQFRARDAVLHTDVEFVDIIPANIDLSAAEVQLVNEVAREQILKHALQDVIDDYDVILIDCQPSLGILAVNSLCASHGVLIPLTTEFFALRGVALLMNTIEKVRDRLNPSLKLDGIVITMFDARTLHSKEVALRLLDEFKQDLLHTSVPRTVKFPDASIASQPITEFATDHKAADAYRQLARELIARGSVA
ncbi:MAG: AAA family ATPase [Bifidobacteriaceae bacterium]|jgi:chromosome partitioning protein|nr:AAA family ATPase [Bifidobacteriaceae bacterium]